MITPEQLARSGSEHGEQSALFLWAAMNRRNAPELELLFAIPNGGERNKAVAANLKAEGVKSGVPDTCLPVAAIKWHVPYAKEERHLARNWYLGLYIEMKKPSVKLKRAPAHEWDTGGVSDNQQAWLTQLTKQGYKCAVCYSWQEAAGVIYQYLTGKELTL